MLQHPLRAREQQLPKRSTIPEYLLIFAPIVAPLAAGWRLQKNDFLKSTFNFVFCFCSKIRRNDDDLMHKKNTKSILNIIKMLRYITNYILYSHIRRRLAKMSSRSRLRASSGKAFVILTKFISDNKNKTKNKFNLQEKAFFYAELLHYSNFQKCARRCCTQFLLHRARRVVAGSRHHFNAIIMFNNLLTAGSQRRLL